MLLLRIQILMEIAIISLRLGGIWTGFIKLLPKHLR